MYVFCKKLKFREFQNQTDNFLVICDQFENVANVRGKLYLQSVVYLKLFIFEEVILAK